MIKKKGINGIFFSFFGKKKKKREVNCFIHLETNNFLSYLFFFFKLLYLIFFLSFSSCF